VSPSAPASRSDSAPSASAPPNVTAGAARPVRHAFPVVGTASYARDHHDYPATDIIAPCGATAVAAVTGRVLEVNRVDTFDPAVNAGATRGGLSVSILGDDGVRYYGSHFQSINSGIAAGVRVSAGQPIAKVGRTGDASACHVHFGISPSCAMTGDWWIRRGVVWPWRYLDSWRAGGSASPVAEVAAWRTRYGCPARPLTDP
jgi:murein DD-endopeptidase MepM/ murein hydrolase activator NlpD